MSGKAESVKSLKKCQKRLMKGTKIREEKCGGVSFCSIPVDWHRVQLGTMAGTPRSEPGLDCYVI